MTFPGALKNSFIWITLIFGVESFAQNLIHNPSFEVHQDCPERLGLFHTNVAFWSCPTSGTTDYFNSCSKAMGTPENFKGKQPADFGNGYVGMYVFAPDDYREYVQVQLKKPLEKGETYRVSFYVSLAEKSDSAIKEFGVLLSNFEVGVETQRYLSKRLRYQQQGYRYTYLEIGYTNFYSDTKDWVLVSSQFEAKGGERFLMLGNFKANARTRVFKTNRNKGKGAYYYLDMISLEKAGQVENAAMPIVIENTLEAKALKLDQNYVFNNVLFLFDRATLLPSAKKELKKVHSLLVSNPSLRIVIQGHTDNIGSQRYNRSLSSKRAKSVADFLENLGVSKNRILWRGYGGTRPINDNTTEEGRKQNRRVEFLITEQSL